MYSPLSANIGTIWQDLLNKQKEYQVDILTSHVISVGEESTPKWAIKLIYGKNSFQEGDLAPVFYTNNLLISRKTLETVNPAFDERFAMTGQVITILH